jgi:hypothetical protein
MRRRCERDDRENAVETVYPKPASSSSLVERSVFKGFEDDGVSLWEKKRKRGALDEKTRSFSSSRPRHLTMHAKKYQNTEESVREPRGTRGFGCDADSRHALVDAHQH